MLEKYKIIENSTIGEAIKKIDKNGNGIVCVVDKFGELLGIFTDGDFRRAIINGAQLTDKISKWMNIDFISAQNTVPISDVKRILINKRMRHLPIVSGKKLVDIVFLNDFEIKDIPVVLMVGGLGSRLYPLTKEIPKPMIKVGDKPILEQIIENFVSQGFTNLILSVNYKKEKIIEYFGNGSDFGATITYVEEKEPLGTGGSLSLMKNLLQDYKQFIVMNGDILAQVDFNDLLKKHNNSNADVTVCTRKYTINIPFGVIQQQNCKIKQIVEKPDYQYLVNSGIYVLNYETLKLLKENEYIDIPIFVNKLIEDGYNTISYQLNGYWFDIGNFEQLEQARNYIEI